MSDNISRRDADIQIAVLTERLTTHIEASETFHKDVLEARAQDRAVMKAIQDELSIYKTIYNVVKFIGYALTSIVIYQIGNTHGVWTKLTGFWNGK